MAIQTFNRVLAQLDKGAKAQGDLYLRIGETYRRKGDLGGAVEALKKARETLPDNIVVLSTLALVLDGAGKRPEAKQVYEATLKLDPNNAVALNNLAFLEAESGGDLDDALTKAQRAKQLLPNLHEISDTLGWIYLKKNLADEAINVFKDLVSKQPNHSTYHFHLGMAYSQKGDKGKAIEQLKEALKYNPAKEEKDKIQQLITRLG
jgi:tetratricopeptide (TPR) repeat protein